MSTRDLSEHAVLIANRGEIAVRIARACRELGMRSIAVYSTADRGSEVTRIADAAVCIGPAEGKRSYLSPAAVVTAALQSGADMVHPGYGFLSENPDFAEICEANGLTFVGPPAGVMAELGDKAKAKSVLSAAGVPLVPGDLTAVDSPGAARQVAEQLGAPLIIKAIAGGGGRGMVIVRDLRDFVPAFERTRAQAHAVFGDGRVYLERYVEGARHVEVQVLCDAHGNGVHLGERDCTVQRRHQKLIEESPAPRLSSALRDRMGETAVRAALAVGFVGAGTFEFLVSPAGEFSFIEINCRIQVEHPVTEMVTGVDLVREQLLVATGRPLSLRQQDIVSRGVALECRINAEDPARGFAPAPGRLTVFVPPGGPFTRVDTHAYSGYEIGPHYDSLLAKVIVWAPDRRQAIARMDRALAELRAEGPRVVTTAPYLRTILAHPDFVAATHATDLISSLEM